MNAYAFFAVFGGAGCGAVLRWGFANWFNPLFPTLPLGTLAANLVGGLLLGFATSFFAHHSPVAPEWRLLVFTGFLGGLTTFSTFSAEVVNLVVRQQFAWAFAAAAVHLTGSLLLAGLGLWLGNGLFDRLA